MMAGGGGTNGPSEADREQPGDTQTNPAGAATQKPAEGADDVPPRQPGSPGE